MGEEKEKEKKRRRKNTDKKIDNKSSFQVTFCKQRKDLFNKTNELRRLCGADVDIIVFSPAGRPFADEPHTRPVLERYLRDHQDDAVTAAGNGFWLDIVDVAKVGSEEELHAMYNALVELHRRVLACPDILSAAADAGSRYLASDHAPRSGFLAAAVPINCTVEQDHVQLSVPGHYRATTTSAMESEPPVFLPATMDAEDSGIGYDPSPEYFAVDPPQGGFLAAAPMDCTSESAVESEGAVILPIPIDVDAQSSGDCPAEPPEFLINEEEEEAWERFWPELDDEIFTEELFVASSVALPGTGIVDEAGGGKYANLPALDLESFCEVPLSYWTSLIPTL